MKHLKYALIATVAFSSMTAFAQEDQKPESSKAVHIAKLTGYSTATLVNTVLSLAIAKYLASPSRTEDDKVFIFYVICSNCSISVGNL